MNSQGILLNLHKSLHSPKRSDATIERFYRSPTLWQRAIERRLCAQHSGTGHLLERMALYHALFGHYQEYG